MSTHGNKRYGNDVELPGPEDPGQVVLIEAHVLALELMVENFSRAGAVEWLRTWQRVPGTQLAGKGADLWLKHPDEVHAYMEAVAEGVVF